MKPKTEEQETEAGGKWTGAVSGAKETLGAVRELGLLLIILLLLAFPKFVNDRLVQVGVTKFEAAGFHWEKAQSASEKTGEAGQQVAAVGELLDSAKKQLDAAAQKNPEVKKAVSVLDQAIETSKNTEKDLRVSLAVQQADLQAAKPAATEASDRWGVVISADKTLADATPEVKRARDLGFQSVTIYDRQNWLRGVVEFSTLAEAQRALPSLQTGTRNSAYLVNLNNWCPVHSDRGDGVKKCEGF